MPTHLEKAFSIDNLRRAWRWIRSNPEAQYKNYFRQVYSAYSFSDEANLLNLHNRLINNTFRPGHSTKIFLPKATGILRTYTLLNIEDQIVYQAMINIVAERLLPRVKKRYNKEVFGHLYAGKSSKWFYRKWSDGYKKFNAEIKEAFHSGYVQTAIFDLTAFYDSIDHNVIRYFFDRLGLDREFSELLLSWLSHWTATHERIYHGHGIPQGPLASGLLSEVVLHYFDSKKRLPRNVRYFRYVDDIKLLAKDEDDLRLSLISLDHLSKNIGLFPQSNKIDMHKIKNINEEIRTVSHPPETAIQRKSIDQKKIRKRLVELTLRYSINNETRFKYVLAHALPSSMISRRLLRILGKYPHLYHSIFLYFSRYEKIPKEISKELYSCLISGDRYFAYQADLLRAVYMRISPYYKHSFVNYLLRRWKKTKKLQHAVELNAVILQWLLSENKLPYKETHMLLANNAADPWLRAFAIQYLNIDTIGKPSYTATINEMLCSQEVDPAIMAAQFLFIHGIPLLKPERQINHLAGDALKIFGIVSSSGRPPSLIGKALNDICNKSLPTFDWYAALGERHGEVEKQLILTHGYLKTDMTAWINALDVFHDILLDILSSHDGCIGRYELGKIGSFILQRTSRFANKYPRFNAACVEIHERRYESALSHPRVKSTQKPTDLIKFSYLKKARPILFQGYSEIIKKW